MHTPFIKGHGLYMNKISESESLPPLPPPPVERRTAEEVLGFLGAFLLVVLLDEVLKEIPDGVEVSPAWVFLLGELGQNVPHLVAKLRQLQQHDTSI